MRRLPERILIATANRGKIREIKDLVKDLPVDFLSIADISDPPEVVEDGESFEENALKKERTLARATGLTALADDSGLCVDALGGRPGVLSARYAGANSTDAEKYSKILDEMADVPEKERSARFVCVVALVSPEGEENLFHGVCEGIITRRPRGTSGFGYDPIFLHPEAGCTFAELDRSEKNRVSHRGRALEQLAEYLKAVAKVDMHKGG